MSFVEANIDFYCLATLTFSTCFLLCRKHLLLLPKQLPGVKTPKDLRRGHLKTLREIHILAARVAAHLEKDGGSVKVGYHALPSMEPLHLHIMVSSIYTMQMSWTLCSNFINLLCQSSDMNSAFLKNRKHWYEVFRHLKYFTPFTTVLTHSFY